MATTTFERSPVPPDDTSCAGGRAKGGTLHAPSGRTGVRRRGYRPTTDWRLPMNEAHFAEIEKTMLYISDARARGAVGEGAREGRRQGSPRRGPEGGGGRACGASQAPAPADLLRGAQGPVELVAGGRDGGPLRRGNPPPPARDQTRSGLIALPKRGLGSSPPTEPSQEPDLGVLSGNRMRHEG